MSEFTETQVSYDPFDFDIDDDPYPVWKRLRDDSRLYYNDEYGFHALTRYADVAAGLHNWTAVRSGSSCSKTLRFTTCTASCCRGFPHPEELRTSSELTDSVSSSTSVCPHTTTSVSMSIGGLHEGTYRQFGGMGQPAGPNTVSARR